MFNIEQFETDWQEKIERAKAAHLGEDSVMFAEQQRHIEIAKKLHKVGLIGVLTLTAREVEK